MDTLSTTGNPLDHVDNPVGPIGNPVGHPIGNPNDNPEGQPIGNPVGPIGYSVQPIGNPACLWS